MYSYASISICALFCYAFLLIAFLAAKKNRIINSFIVLLLLMICWTGGSFFMRMGVWPYEKFWFHVSLCGLLFMPLGFFSFIQEFMEVKGGYFKPQMLVVTVSMVLINILTEVFIKAPTVKINAQGRPYYVYEAISGSVSVLFIVSALTLIACGVMVYINARKNALIVKKLQPIFCGILAIVLGHVLLMFPWFKGFPIDICSGVINAGFMFYALYEKRLFKLTLLTSQGNCYAIAVVMAVGIFYNMIHPMERFIRSRFFLGDAQIVVVISVVFMLSTILFYTLLKRFFNSLFVREELMQGEYLKEFSNKVSKSLKMHEILTELIEVIQKGIHVEQVYVCIADDDKEYKLTESTSPLKMKNFVMPKDHPIVEYMKHSDECLMMKDFKRTVGYRSMWEEEKELLARWNIECFVGLKDEDEVVGIVMLSNKVKKERYTYDDMNFLSSVDSVSSMVIKNSKLYEKAYEEARKDHLTGVLNRKSFFEVLNDSYEEYKGCSLALSIINIDDFKLYNQLYGDREGDEALRKIAQIIEASVGENGNVARYSGKEFAVILPGYDLQRARELTENIAKQIREMNKNAKDYAMKALTVSCGICAVPYSASTVQELVNNADMAVYHVKHTGKNAVMVYSEAKNQRTEMEVKQSVYREGVYSEYASTIYALTAAIDTKDHYTFSHSKNVAYYAGELAAIYGMNQECIDIVREAGLLHDIGKIGIPEEILNKPGKLTDEEYEIMKGHVENSIGIIRHLPSLDYVIPAVIGHHERYDGNGYPRRIAGKDIPLMARMLGIADSFDAMVSERSYKKSMKTGQALGILREETGKQFDPELVTLFTEAVENGRITVSQY